eukprot:485426-Prorocentrum_minimum.AAC.2
MTFCTLLRSYNHLISCDIGGVLLYSTASILRYAMLPHSHGRGVPQGPPLPIVVTLTARPRGQDRKATWQTVSLLCSPFLLPPRPLDQPAPNNGIRTTHRGIFHPAPPIAYRQPRRNIPLGPASRINRGGIVRLQLEECSRASRQVAFTSCDSNADVHMRQPCVEQGDLGWGGLQGTGPAPGSWEDQPPS